MRPVSFGRIYLFFGCFLIVCFLCVSTASVWADCPGEVRPLTSGEKRLAAWVDTAFPHLVKASSDYALDVSFSDSSRDFRCEATENDPYALSKSMRFLAQGAAAEAVNAQADDMAASMQKMMEEMQRMQQAGVPPEQAMAQINAQTEALKNQSSVAQGQSGIKVKAYFNTKSSKCVGKQVKIPGASFACRKTKKQNASLYVLFGPWKKDGSGRNDYRAALSPAASSEQLQSISLLVDTSSDILDDVIRRTDWHAISGRIGK